MSGASGLSSSLERSATLRRVGCGRSSQIYSSSLRPFSSRSTPEVRLVSKRMTFISQTLTQVCFALLLADSQHLLPVLSRLLDLKSNGEYPIVLVGGRRFDVE
jgi:hypothetical protein